QTAPSPTAAIAGRCPTAITASAAPEGNGDADELALDPAGAHPVIAASSTNAAIHVPRPVALLNMDLGNEVASGGGGRRPLIDADDGVIGSSRQSAGGPRVLVVGQRIAA